MSHDTLTYEDLLRIVELIKSSEQFSEFRLKVGEIEVELRRGHAASPAPTAPAAPVESAARASAPAAQAAPTMASVVAPAAAPPPSAASPAASRALPDLPKNAVVIRAPMVGTFYRAPEPGAPPFVAVGDRVDSETIVCIIEVMKLMNSIPAGADGTVTHVLVDDAAPVEAGQPIIVLQPAQG